MASPAHNVMHAFRRFVGLRSAWRRSLAMEPREATRRCPETNRPEPCRRPAECRTTAAGNDGYTAGQCRV